MSVSKEIHILKEISEDDLESEFAQQTFGKINNCIYKTTSFYDSKGIKTKETKELFIIEDLKNYLTEFSKVISGKHKGKYKNLDANKFKKQ